MYSLGQESKIKTKQKLTKLSLPSFDLNKFEASMAGVSLNLISDQAEELTKQHIKEMLDENGEKWLEYGVTKLESDKCPFCKQDISGIEIVAAFKTYFSFEYQKSIKFINTLSTSFKQKFGFDTLSFLNTNLNTNLILLSFWQNHIVLEED